MSETLEGKVAVVTGAGRGIGRACAVRLAGLGADVTVVDIDLHSGRHYAGEPDGPTTERIEALGRRALGVQADLAVEEEAHRAVASATEALGRLDILVNVAGGSITPFDRSRASITPSVDVRKHLDVNLMGTIYCCQAAVPAMRAAGGGAIVNFTSTAAFSVFADGSLAAYAMSKAAVAHYSRHLAVELGPENIRVNMVAPGITLTGRVVDESGATGFSSRAAEVPMRRLARGRRRRCRVPRRRSLGVRDRPLHSRRWRLGPGRLLSAAQVSSTPPSTGSVTPVT
jgi:NAD(P)-dependent dehydrogenase (short-subunit alcohol dehydrogenase family)